MTQVKIKHAQFMYYEDTGETQTNFNTGEETPKLVAKFAFHEEVVDIPRQEDYDRGVEVGAFFEEDDEKSSDDEESEEESEEEPISTETHDELVEWIRDDRPTAAQVVKAAGNDPDKARRLMAAEEEASGSQPRKSVMDPLRKIAGD